MNSETQFIGSITKRRQCSVHSVEDRSFFILFRVPEWFYMVIATVREVCVLIMRHSEKAPVCYFMRMFMTFQQQEGFQLFIPWKPFHFKQRIFIWCCSVCTFKWKYLYSFWFKTADIHIILSIAISFSCEHFSFVRALIHATSLASWNFGASQSWIGNWTFINLNCRQQFHD